MLFTSRQIVTSSWALVVVWTTMVYGKVTAPSHLSNPGTTTQPEMVAIASAAIQDNRARTKPLPDPVSCVTSETAPAWQVDPRSFLLETSAVLRLKRLPRANKAELVIEPKNDSPTRLQERPSHVTRDDRHCLTAVTPRPGLR
jgi:hypothetical protein